MAPRRLLILMLVALAAVAGTANQASAIMIDFETYVGTSTFAAAGPAQTLIIPTAIGNVTFSGGVILTQATNCPADQSSMYASADFGSGLSNPLTVTFPVPVTNFFLDVLNGEPYNEDYTVADNASNLATFTLIPNTNSGMTTIGFAATGSVVTITALPAGQPNWDFAIDNVHFNEALPPNFTPEPVSMALMGTGLLGLAALRRLRRK